MNRSESILFDPDKLTELRKLISKGEGLHLEFKRKALHPDKILRELIAFANSGGGILLVGVDDDKSIPGLKFPEHFDELAPLATRSCRVEASRTTDMTP